MPESAPGKLTRQQIYDRIRQSSRDEYILEEMIRLGFWPEEEAQPSLPADLIRRQGELERELRELAAKQRMVEDPEAALKQMRKERLAASRKRREENRIKRIEATHARALAWRERRKKEILHLGPDVSGGLNNRTSDANRLARLNLPDLPDALSLSNSMGIELAELRFLAYARPTSTVSHYQRFAIPKKTGGERQISAPMPRLKRAHYWILENILTHIPLPDAAHGFIPKRSIVTNATPHVGAAVVVNLDLKDFFPTIGFPRIKGLFRSLGYSEQTAVILGLLCSEPDVDEVELDNVNYFVGRGSRFLPQGAPTSPAISNLICCRLDRRLGGAAKKLEFQYTRYADDLTFSSARLDRGRIPKLLWRTRQIVQAEGFELNTAKTRVMHAGRRQEVTGLVVNRKPSIRRRTLKRFRALLFQIEKDGPEGKRWGENADLFESIQGYANFIRMVDPPKGEKYMERVRRIVKKYNHRPVTGPVAPLEKTRFRKKAAAGEPPRDDWWQVEEKPAPELLPPVKKEPKPAAARGVALENEGPPGPPPEAPPPPQFQEEEEVERENAPIPRGVALLPAVIVIGVLASYLFTPWVGAMVIIAYLLLWPKE